MKLTRWNVSETNGVLHQSGGGKLGETGMEKKVTKRIEMDGRNLVIEQAGSRVLLPAGDMTDQLVPRLASPLLDEKELAALNWILELGFGCTGVIVRETVDLGNGQIGEIIREAGDE
jgi:hypothetical protein